MKNLSERFRLSIVKITWLSLSKWITDLELNIESIYLSFSLYKSDLNTYVAEPCIFVQICFDEGGGIYFKNSERIDP